MSGLDRSSFLGAESGWLDTKERCRLAAVDAMRELSGTMERMADALDQSPNDVAGFNALDALAIQQLQQFRTHLDRFGGLKECHGEA